MAWQDGKQDERIRVRFAIRGRVQGVGFRPAIYRIAAELDLSGVVGNDSNGAFVEVEGQRQSIQDFRNALDTKLPNRARISQIDATLVTLHYDNGFWIEHSQALGEQQAEITPEIATCDDCLREIHEPDDRRYRYPFTNCTNCGPRYSIVQGIPYDRVNTTMSAFTMCANCQAEYDNPLDRRFHAQPNACPVCGPQLRFIGDLNEEDPIRACAELLRAGGIVAIKGLGGFHLACRADSSEAVTTLRERKHREAKPLALMVRNAGIAKTLAEFDAAAIELMQSWRSPIVLGRKKPDADLAPEIAPNCSSYGVMLPYTPIHHLLLDEDLPPLVMTSANPTDEPLCADNDEAMQRLNGIADGFLLHDRDIERRVDDSVVLALPGALIPVRRSRGYVPEPIELLRPAEHPILAVGGDMKSVVCLVKERGAVLSEHLGELGNPAAFRNFVSAIDRFKEILRAEPATVVADLHPEYHSTRFARTLGLPLVQVQHHHAHIEACKVEYGIKRPMIGLAADGTGYGTDGAIWGCELIRADGADFERLMHLRYFGLVGGDAAAKDTWRPAVAILVDTFGQEWQNEFPWLDAVPPNALKLLAKRLDKAAQTSSLGRLFDAVAFIMGASARNAFEADAAMTLEALALDHGEAEPLPFAIENGELDWRPMVRELVTLRRNNVATAELAARFHDTLIRMLAEAIGQCCRDRGEKRAVLSGGCFLNSILSAKLPAALAERGIHPYIHTLTPPGDGCLALGQAAVAVERQRRGL